MGSALDALVLASEGYHTATLAGRQYRWRGDGFVEFWLPEWQGRPGEWRQVASPERIAELEALSAAEPRQGGLFEQGGAG